MFAKWIEIDSRFAFSIVDNGGIYIEDEYHAQLLAEQSAGRQIFVDKDGYPVAIATPVPARTKISLLADVAAKRWQVETSGIAIADYHIATDRESQSQLFSVYTSLKSGLINDSAWKTADGSFTQVTLPDLEPIAQAVASHVRACFAAEEMHYKEINAMQTQTELNAYDISSGWPSGS